MVYDRANELAKELAESEEYRAYNEAKERAFEDETTKSLLKEYMKQRVRAQGAMMSGSKDEAGMERLQKLGEVLGLNHDASDFLIAEYRLNTMLGDVYRILAEAIDIDLGILEDK